MAKHHELTGFGAIHPFAFIGSSDPAADPAKEVAPGKAWVDTSRGFVLKVRNATDDGWDAVTPPGVPVLTDSTTARTADPATDAGVYVRFTNSAPKTYTFDDADSFQAGEEYHVRNVGAGDLTLTEAGTMVLNPPAGGTLVLPEGGTATVKIVGASEADVFGLVNSI